MRRLPATGLIALLGCTVRAEIELPDGSTPPQAQVTTGEAKSGEPALRPWPEPRIEPIVFPDGAPIIEVVQFEYLQSPPAEWTLDPHGNWLAEPSDDGCDVWDIESGLRLGPWNEPSIDPCTQWPAPELVLGYGVDPNSFDGALTAAIAKANVEISSAGAVVQTLECRGCAEVRAFAWEPRGHRLALVREGGGVELWDADTGQRRATLSKRAQLDKRERIDAIRIAWSSLGVLVSHDVKRPNGRTKSKHNYEADFFDWHTQIELWNDSGTSVQAFRSNDDRVMDLAFTDPTRQWLLVIHDDPNPFYELGQSLAVYPLAGRHSALAWEDWDRSIPDEMTEYQSSGGHWRVDASTMWLADYTEATLYGGEWAFGLAVLRTEPTPAFERLELLRDDEEALAHDGFELQAFGHAAGKAVIEWAYVDANGQRVEHGALDPASPDCDRVDVSPDLAIELLRCPAELRVRSGSRSRTFSRNSEWLWGRGGWLAIEHGGRLTVLDAGLEVLVDRRGSMIDAALANTHDLLALQDEDVFELLDPRTNSSVVQIEQRVRAAALSPDGKRVATLGEREVRVFAVESGTLLARWDEPAAQRLAFSQDGRLLFTGGRAPERAWNSYTSELVTEGVVRVEGTLDPSWRWSMSGHDRVVRTLDGLALTLGPNWAMLDDGRFVGTPPIERTRDRTFRVGEALALPSCDFADLEPWLHRPQLVEDFFAGRPIAPAVVPFDQVARTKCSKP
ncbi:MAG TPA: hypothetical protein VM869_02725 [Enhygromyxa sp.]|nr:hypothetical protein [Enhygromyxa sp.]